MATATLDSIPSWAQRLHCVRWLCWLAAGFTAFACLGLPAVRSQAAEDLAAPSSPDPPKRQLIFRTGPSDHSHVQAVLQGLKWLAEHQMPDGGWSFDHTQAPNCGGKCRNPGELSRARNAATGLALLAFLGAGQTQKAGSYASVVKAGRYFLIGRMKVGSQSGSLLEGGGTMYSHGICSIALCEGYAMTRRHFRYPSAQAQWAIDFLCYAQDPVGGGWRYMPRQRGDTSVTGWQLAALRSAQLAELRVPPPTAQRASEFLDSVQAEDGARYGYTEPAADRQATTAIGLLARMYLGWKPDHPAIQRGVEWLSQQGPSKSNMYYNYFAHQVMHHVGGESWRDWNEVMSEHLVRSQVQEGHEKGSWYFPGKDPGASKGGRLYCTAMAVMTMEVYYRHLTIYKKASDKRDQ